MIKLLKKYMKKNIVLLCENVFFVFIQVIIQTVFLMKEMKNIIDKGVGLKNMDYIIQSGIRMLLFTLAVGLCTVIASKLSAKITAGITTSVRADCYKKVISLSPQDYNHFGESTLLTRTLTDGAQIQIFMINIMRSALTVPIIIIVMLVLIYRINKLLFWILFVAFALTVAMLVAFGSKSKRRFEKLQQRIDYLNLLMKEKITGVRSIRAFNNEKLEEEKLEGANQDAYKAAIDANKINNFMSPLSMIIMNWSIVLIYLAGSKQLQTGMASISDLLLVFQYLAYFITSLAIVPVLVNLLPKVAVSCSRINELLDYEPEVDNHEGADKIRLNHGEIMFKDVIFGYAKATNTIANVSFTAKAGKTTAFIGTTGSGKTTIMNLIMGFYEPTFGEIFVDGQSIKNLDKNDYRQHISYATQSAYVFQDSAYNNITMYNKNTTRERVHRACLAAQFDEVIDKMPQGLETVMSQGGRNISGGQRQRMSLARTVAKIADIYIFDDTFSALDAKTEKAALTEIRKELEGKTVIMVAQRISTILDADKIVVLDQGKIVGTGTHHELLNSCKEYQEIYETQCYLEKEN